MRRTTGVAAALIVFAIGLTMATRVVSPRAPLALPALFTSGAPVPAEQQPDDTAVAPGGIGKGEAAIAEEAAPRKSKETTAASDSGAAVSRENRDPSKQKSPKLAIGADRSVSRETSSAEPARPQLETAPPAKPVAAEPAAQGSRSTRPRVVASAPPPSAERTFPAGATALCRDGTLSYSKTRSGTCSFHGGVQQWLR